MKKCVICGKEFEPKCNKQLCCSPECSRERKNAKEREKYANDPEHRERAKERDKERREDPERRAKKRAKDAERRKERYSNDPEYRESLLAPRRTQEFREKRNAKLREKSKNDKAWRERENARMRELRKDPERRERDKAQRAARYKKTHVPADREGSNFCVYIHTDQLGKVYIGRAVGDNVTTVNRQRWHNGHGYKQCPRFWEAIKEYGWNNIQHELLEWGLRYDQALERERYWIERYNSTNPEYGYNVV